MKEIYAVRHERLELEEKISELIDQFEAQTDCIVTSIKIKHDEDEGSVAVIKTDIGRHGENIDKNQMTLPDPITLDLKSGVVTQ
jgi:hypothetical protein